MLNNNVIYKQANSVVSRNCMLAAFVTWSKLINCTLWLPLHKCSLKCHRQSHILRTPRQRNYQELMVNAIYRTLSLSRTENVSKFLHLSFMVATAISSLPHAGGAVFVDDRRPLQTRAPRRQLDRCWRVIWRLHAYDVQQPMFHGKHYYYQTAKMRTNLSSTYMERRSAV